MKHKGTKNLAILLALVLLFALVPGLSGKAHADNTEILLTTITATAKEQASYSTANVATVSFSYTQYGSSAYTAIWGWWGYGWSATVNAADGYTITKCVFYDDQNRTATDSEAPFSVETTEEDKTPQVNGTPILAYQSKGIKKIEVYGYATPAAVSVTGVSLNKTSTTLTVDTTETLTATVSPDDATDKSVSWSSDNTAVATVTDGVVTAVAPGTANITVTTTDGNKQATCAVTVSNPAIAINPGVRNSTYDNGVYKVIYDGNPYSVIVNVTTPASGATVKYGTASETCTLDASPTITNVAESPLTVYYRVTADGYTTLRGNATVEISKAEQTAPDAPKAESASTNSITLNTIPNGEYKCGDGEWQTSPTFNGLTMNTSYTFYQRLAADANHNPSPASSAASISTLNHVHNWSYEAHGATITATCANTDGGHDGETTATLTINAPALTTYGGTGSAEATLTGLDAFNTATGLAVSATDIKYYNVVKIEIDGSTFERLDTENPLNAAPTDAGKYGAGITLEAEESTRAFVWYTIAKADIAPDVSISGWTYGQTANTPLVGGNTGGGTETITYAAKGSTDFSATVPTNAGEYTVKAKVDATNNYNGGEATADFTISRASITPTVSINGWTYGQTANTPLVGGNTGGGTETITYAVRGSTDFSATVPANAGDYTVKYTVAESTNYNGGETTADFTISKATVTVIANDMSKTYGAADPVFTYTSSGLVGSDTLSGALSRESGENARTYAIGQGTLTAGDNYDISFTGAIFTITKTDLAVTAAGYTGSYDGAAHGITVDVGSSGATVYYAATELTAENYATAGSTTAPTYTDAGENTVYFYVVSGNYDPDVVSGSKTVIITRATGTATDAQKPTAKTDLVADNTDQALVTTPAALPEGYTKLQYSLDGETWTDTVPTGKDAGSYTVNYKYVGDKNHNDFQGEPFTVTIKTLTVSFEVNGGSAVAAQSVIKNGKLEQPANPTREGYAFDGWFEDATCTVPYDFNKTVTGNVTLYAKWTPNVYQLTNVTGATTDANHIWYKQSGTDTVTNNNTGVEITVKLTNGPDDSFDHFTGVQLDGVTLTRDVDYAARAGSTVVTLFPATLRRLSNGAHTLTVLFDNNSVSTRLTVRQNSSTPATGDESNAALWAVIVTVSMLGLAALTVENKKRRTAKR